MDKLIEGFEVLSIREEYGGMRDNEIVNLIKRMNGILLTEDKDFGELVFAHSVQEVSIIFLRYDQPKYESIEDKLLTIVKKYYAHPEAVFITITKSKIRIRKI